MSDSQKLIIRLPEVLPEHGLILFPAKHLLIIDEKRALTLKSVEGDICGLTTAKNKITAITNAVHEVCAYGFSQITQQLWLGVMWLCTTSYIIRRLPVSIRCNAY